MRLKAALKIVIFVITLVCNAAVVFYFWASDSDLVLGETVRSVETIDSANTQTYNRSTLKVLTWNLAYGHGLGSEGIDYIPKTRLEHLNTIRQMGELIKKLDVDIVLLQEIDWASSRTRNIDQVEFLASRTGLIYAARALSWDANYVPYPYLPVSSHFGKINSGGAIISRIPLDDNIVALLNKPSSMPWWKRRMYLYRYSQAVSFKINSKKYWILNHHLEAFNKTNRQQQAQDVLKHIKGYEGNGTVLAFGGDFNAIPPETRYTGKYFGGEGENYKNDSTIDIFRGHSSFNDSVEQKEYLLNEKHYYSFPAHDADRRLDYLFINKQATILSSRVVIEAGDLSDHLPFLVEIKL